MNPADSQQPIQASVIPFQRRNGQIEFCLITTRKRNWIFPKGIIDPGETMEQTAAKEALEEAGTRDPDLSSFYDGSLPSRRRLGRGVASAAVGYG